MDHAGHMDHSGHDMTGHAGHVMDHSGHNMMDHSGHNMMDHSAHAGHAMGMNKCLPATNILHASLQIR